MEPNVHRVFVVTAVTITPFLFAGIHTARAQSNTPRFEIGGQFSSIRASNTPGATFLEHKDRWDSGGGARLTFNLNRNVALESEVNFFKERDVFSFEGTKIEGLFGAKVGMRRNRFGVFGKLRPGFMHFERDSDCPACKIEGNCEFALDAGGVVEFYPSRKFVVRFDAGDTIIFLEEKRGTVEGFPTVFQNSTRLHSFQFSIGAGIRF